MFNLTNPSLYTSKRFLNDDRVEVYIPTKDRPECLALLIQSLLFQTHKNWNLTIIDDSTSGKILTDYEYIKYLLFLLQQFGHEWRVIYGRKKGPHYSHCIASNVINCELLLRLDDDLFLMPDVIENLVNSIKINENTGAVGFVILQLENIFAKLPENWQNEQFFDGKVANDGTTTAGLQTYVHNDGNLKYVEHLYSSFLYRKSAIINSGGFPENLSIVGHREETIATYRMFKNGYKIAVDPNAIGYHFKYNTGGIRETQGKINEQNLWEHDEQIYLNEINRLRELHEQKYKI
ncbi:MAG: glycosyltransferase [Acidithiobacillus sp.]|jgi:glycosyltransferase involved in cell wall biosynthesis|uniref:glycosyltransferase n=1 Tax=Acidithiobacillus sp. TaxID=1872118 RepID=UPI00355F8C35